MLTIGKFENRGLQAEKLQYNRNIRGELVSFQERGCGMTLTRQEVVVQNQKARIHVQRIKADLLQLLLDMKDFEEAKLCTSSKEGEIGSIHFYFLLDEHEWPEDPWPHTGGWEVHCDMLDQIEEFVPCLRALNEATVLQIFYEFFKKSKIMEDCGLQNTETSV